MFSFKRERQEDKPANRIGKRAGVAYDLGQSRRKSCPQIGKTRILGSRRSLSVDSMA